MPDRSTLANDDVVTVDDGAWIDNPIVVQFVVRAMTHVLSFPEVEPLENLILLLSVRVRSEESRAEKASVNA